MSRRTLNKKRIFKTIMIGLVIVAFIITGVKVFTDSTNDKEKVIKKHMSEIKPYGYKLDDRDTKTYKKYFDELEKILKQDPIDEKKYASTLTQIFITDFYTLKNKLASTDIGGIEFIHKSQIENFQLKAQETIYKHIKSDLYGDRKQKLPEVKDVTIDSVEASKYTIKGDAYEGYTVKAKWEYKEDMGYDTEGTFKLIKTNDKLNIVEKVNNKKEDN